MCVSFWLLDKHPTYWLILALNRDEFHSRRTLAAHFWEGEDVLAGRDVQGGGTWMGITKTGRLAFLTNVREAFGERHDCTTRGGLPTRFLKSHKTPREYLNEVALEADNYNGFNLVVADFKELEMAFLSNRHNKGGPSVKIVSPGLHSLSNGTLDSSWPKMERGKRMLESLLANLPSDAATPSEQIVDKILSDRTKAADVSVQQAETFYPEVHERHLSPIFVDNAFLNEPYGTRSMAVVAIRRDGNVSLFERYLEGDEWKDHTFEFQVQAKPKSMV